MEETVSDDSTSKKSKDPVCKCLHHGPKCTCSICDYSPKISEHVCVCSQHASDCKCEICIRTSEIRDRICVCTSHGSICTCKICVATPTVRTSSLTGPVCVCASRGSVCKCLTCIRSPPVSDFCICASHGSDCQCQVCIRTPTVSDRVCICASHTSACKCPICIRTPTLTSEKIEICGRKLQILSTVSRTENYLRDHRIPELISFLLTKLLADGSNKPIAYLVKLLDDCMLYRAGQGLPPVLYEQRHLEAIIKSFDPGRRGWISADQLRRMYTTVGLNSTDIPEDERIPTDDLQKKLTLDQEIELYDLVVAGTTAHELSTISKTDSNPV
ncbi:uncharacterized protein LOC113230485 [Hyposmocoma kahamanoa]|uniref:uncharacterized protein LOC113230485 n=1 Tax=Hyposmocoma kahamanoa TaxID=1477025 RepID=UPI000E6D8286|nr:uncharacterized protein LOC113230485 [Hyposmocoma kahamanoa]